jgi:RND family efflux transporter MFP subunit
MKWIYITLATLSLFACKKKTESAKAVSERISSTVYASGFVKSNNQYQVYSTVNGLIEERLVKEGDTVLKDQPIIRLSNPASQLNIENAKLAADYATANLNSDKLNELQSNIDLARTKLNNDKSLFERQQNLWNQNIGSKNELDQRELAVKNSSAALDAAILRLNDLKKQLQFNNIQSKKNVEISKTIHQDYLIKSKTNGRVFQLLKEKGELVTPQSPVAVIGEGNHFLIELQVDEYDIAKISIGQKMVLSFDSYKGQTFEASISKIYPIMNDRSRSFTVEATFITQPAVLYPNLTVEANIILETKENAILIPRNYLVNDSTVLLENNEIKKIKTGLKDYQKVEIVEGLKAGDIILKPAK